MSEPKLTHPLGRTERHGTRSWFLVRRTKHESAETKAAILDAAQACYLERGVSSTSLADVAKRAGCSRGAIYWHFPEPSALLKSVIERGRYPLAEHLRAAEASPEGPLAALEQAFLEYLQALRTSPHVRASTEIRLFRCDATQAQGQVSRTQAAVAAQVMDELQPVLEKAESLGELAADSTPDAAAVLLSSTLVGLVALELLSPSKGSLQTHAATAIRSVFAG